jgi:hypothetical protein
MPMTPTVLRQPSVGQFPWGDRFLGRAAIRNWAAKTFHDIPDIHWELVHQITNDSHAVFSTKSLELQTGAKRGLRMRYLEDSGRLDC